MEPDSIDSSSITITQPPTNMSSETPAQNSASTPNVTDTSSTPAKQTTPTPDSPKLTLALEALLGGLEPPAPETKPSSDPPIIPENITSDLQSPQIEQSSKSQIESPPRNANSSEDAEKVVFEGLVNETQSYEALDTVMGEDTNAAEPLVSTDTQLPSPKSTAPNESKTTEGEPASENVSIPTENTDVNMGEIEGNDEEHPEWEVDSSPIESSSEDSSDDSSSEDSDDNAYKLLSPEEQARILMADGGSDDEGETKGKSSGGQLRTKNEVPDVVVPKPDVTITPEMPIVELGIVETIVDNIILIKGKTSGEYRVLESGSVLCLEDRAIIGVVAEPMGRVQQPLYSVMFTNAASITEAGLSIGIKVYYSEQHATYVFTQALKAFKGSDASNLHDEEVGDDEMEFSDDEAELEHKRRVKQKRNEKHGARVRDGGSNKNGHSAQPPNRSSTGLNYDEMEDGPYKPLARPTSLMNSTRHVEAPQESLYTGGPHGRENFRGRGRGDRGRGRGDRGRGKGGGPSRGGSNNGYSQPSQNHPTSSHPWPPFQNSGDSFSQPQQSQTPYYNMPQQYPNPHQQIPTWPQFPTPPYPNPQQQQQQQQQQPYQQQGFHQAYQNMQNMWQNAPNMPPPQIPAGAFLNPAFFGQAQPSNNAWDQQGQTGSNGSNDGKKSG